MQAAIAAAQQAERLGEVPIGAVLVHEGKVLATSGNTRESMNNPVGHAEIEVLRQAAQALGRWRLTGCTLYVTLEPCTMCAGALVLSRIDRVVYGASDPKAGAVKSLYQILSDPRLNHSPKVTSGVLEDECSQMLSQFFQRRRAKSVLT